MTVEIGHLRITIDSIEYIIETAKEVLQKVGRPRNRQARFCLILRRPRGCNRYTSFMYNDGTCCNPFLN